MTKHISQIIHRFTRSAPAPAAPVVAVPLSDEPQSLPPYVAIYKIHTYDPHRGYLIMFGTPGKGKNFRLKRTHWAEPRAYQVQEEICTAVGWPEHFENEEQLLRYVNAAREFARSRHYAIVH